MSYPTVSVASTLNLSGTWNIRRYTNHHGLEKLRLERDHAVAHAVLGSGQAGQEGQDPVSPVSEDQEEDVRPDTAELNEGEPMEEEEYPDEEEEVEAEEAEEEGAEEEEGRSSGDVADEEMADGSIKKEESDGDDDGGSDVEHEDENEDGEDSEESEGDRAEQALAKAAQKAPVKPTAPAKPPQQPGPKNARGKGKPKHGWDWAYGPAKTIDQGLNNILSDAKGDAPNGSGLLRRSSRAPSTTSIGQTPGHMPPPASAKTTPSNVSKTPARKRKRDSFAV